MNIENEYLSEQKLLEDMRQSYSLLFIAANRLQAEVDAMLDELTSKQLMLLTAVAHCDPVEATIMNISAILGFTKQNTTRMVQGLCQKKILKSVASETDKRSVNIQLTDLGYALLEKNVPKGNEYFMKIFEDFTPDEITAFRGFLEKLTNYDNHHQTHLEGAIKNPIHTDRSKKEAIYKKLHDKVNNNTTKKE